MTLIEKIPPWNFQARVISVDPDGTLSICAYAKEKIGNFSSFNNLCSSLNYFDSLEKKLIGNIEECKGCPIEGFCIGNCYITSELIKNNIKNFNYLCEIQKLATYILSFIFFIKRSYLKLDRLYFRCFSNNNFII